MTIDRRLEQYYLTRILYWREMMGRLDEQTVKQCLKVLKEAKHDVTLALVKKLSGVKMPIEFDENRSRALGVWIDSITEGARASIGETIGEATTIAAVRSLSTHADILSVGGLLSVNSVGMTAEQIRTWFQDTPVTGNRKMSVWVDSIFGGVKSEVQTALQQSGVLGESIEKASARVLYAAIDKGFVVAQRDAVTLARTYIQTANVQAQEATYKANSDIIDGLKWVTTFGNHTCPICAALSESFYKLDEQHPPIPRHFRCRCVLRPVTKTFRELGLNADEFREVERPWTLREDGSIGTGGLQIKSVGTTRGTFESWWRGLDESEQIKIMGDRRTELLKSGEIDWKDLVDHKTGRYRTVREILARK